MSKSRIILIVFLPTLLMAMVILSYYASSQYKSGILEIHNELENHVVEFSKRFATNASNISRQINVFASFLNSNDSMEIRPLLRQTMENMPFVSAVIVAYDPDFLDELRKGKHPEYELKDRVGNIMPPEKIPDLFAPALYRSTSGELLHRNEAANHYETQDWFLVPKLVTSPRWIVPFFNKSTHDSVSSYGRPFYHDGKLAGIVCCFVPMNALVYHHGKATQFDKEIKGIEGGYYFIISHDGRIIYHSLTKKTKPFFSLYSAVDRAGHLEVYKTVDQVVLGLVTIVHAPYMGENRDDDLPKMKFDERLYIISTPRSETNWTLVGVFDEKKMTESLYWQIFKRVMTVLSGVLLICSIVSFGLIHANRPIVVMTQLAKQVAEGRRDVKVSRKYTRRNDIIGNFAVTFNTMISNLTDNLDKAVQASSSRLLLEDELHFAQALQEAFLPERHFIDSAEKGYGIGGQLIPARFVAGDFYDYWEVNEKTVGLVVADVAGKGISAAMIMVATRTLLRQIANGNMSPGEILTEINKTLSDINRNETFVTVFLGFYHIDTGILNYANAGHNPPYLIRANGTLETFPYAKNMAVNIMEDVIYQTFECQLEHGDLLFMYTDGVTDATSAEGVQFGEKNLRKLLLQLANKPAALIIKNVIQTLESYRGNYQADDITTVILKRKI